MRLFLDVRPKEFAKSVAVSTGSGARGKYNYLCESCLAGRQQIAHRQASKENILPSSTCRRTRRENTYLKLTLKLSSVNSLLNYAYINTLQTLLRLYHLSRPEACFPRPDHPLQPPSHPKA